MPQTDSEKFVSLQENFYSFTVEDLLKKFNSFTNGLTDKQAEEKLKIYGLKSNN